MRKKWFVILIITLFTFLFVGCKSTSSATQSVVTQTVTSTAGVAVQGHVEPKKYTDLSFAIPGHVSEVLVSEGDSVAAGQVLAILSGQEARQADLTRAKQAVLAAQQSLDDLLRLANLTTAQANAAIADNEKAIEAAQKKLDELTNDKTATSADLLQARARLNLASAQLMAAQDTAKRLNDGVDPDTLDAAQANLATAQATIKSAQSALDSLELRAPAAGAIASLNLKIGEFVAVGQPVATIADFTTWVIKTDDLTELEVVKVTLGQGVTIVLDALPDEPMTGKVSQIASRFEEKRGDVVYTVTIELDSLASDARWGMTGQTQFSQGR